MLRPQQNRVTVANVRTGMPNPRNMASLRQNLVTVATFRTRLFQNPRNIMLRPQRNRVTVATFQARICPNLRKTHIPK